MIRRGGPQDFPALIAMFDQAVEWMVARGQTGQWGSDPWSSRPKTVERVRAMTESDGFWVTDRDGETIAALLVEQRPDHVEPADEPELYIGLLIVDRRFAGQDLGGALVHHARALARDAGVGLLRVDCWAGAPRLVQWYEDQGFTRAGTFTVMNGEWTGQVFAMRP